MTELEQNLNEILLEKQTKIIPENIKEGITVLGITGECKPNETTPHELEYIEFFGTQAYNTGYRHTANTNIKAKFRTNGPDVGTTSPFSMLFGARKNGYQNNAFAFFTRFNSSNFCYCRTGNEKTGTSMFYTDVTLEINGKVATYSDGLNSYSITTTGTLDSGVNDLFIGAINTTTENNIRLDTSTSDSLRIYYFQIYEGATLVKDYVPYMNEHGVIGLLEKISNTFLEPYHTVIAGPEVN